MPLNKLCDIYSFDTSSFYTDEELQIDVKLNKTRRILNKIKNKYKNSDYNEVYYNKHTKKLNSIIGYFKSELKSLLQNNINMVRTVRKEKLIDKNVISIFDSNLTRSLKMTFDNINLQMIVIKVYYFDVMQSIVNNGFYLSGDKYIFFSASAGQVRTKKFVAVKEDLLKNCWNTLTCGLSIDKINSMGGVNRNKYLAYLALCNSATDVIDFDIDKSIVVEDFETLVNGEVDYIDNKTFKITRQFMDVPITHSDGCGIINYGDKNFMCRAPWIKGLLSPFRFHDFIREHCPDGDCVVKDIYGKEYKIIEDDIQVIFTRSQFKMAKYFDSWQSYKDNYMKYNCTFGICNEEDTFPDTTLNYQMLQTLTDVSEEELQHICKSTRNKIRRLSSDIQTMLKVFGATKYNTNKNDFQKCLEIYPELLQDVYCRETLRDIKNKLEKESWAGKIDIYGKYAFVIPDLYAFSEHLFLELENPQGLLQDGEVYCKLFKVSDKLDCLRSPHLDRSHGIRNNIAKSCDNRLKWFITNGIYTSCHDLISKLLQFDCDGDKLLVVGDRKFVEIAERNMQDIVPLYYEMGKADPQTLNNKILYDGMILAYTNGNIGVPSNDISKGWDEEIVDIDSIKILSSMVNYSIDYAKTLFKPEVPKEIQKKIRAFTKKKVPHFFIYAKDKEDKNVEPINNSTVNRIRKYIPKHKLKFNTSSLGKFNYRILMRGDDVEQNDLYWDVVKKYRELSRSISIFSNVEGNEKNNYNHLFKKVISELTDMCPDKYLLTNILVDNLFNLRKSKHKKVFWNCFGDIIFDNLTNNMVDDYIYCSKCGKRFYREHPNEVLCVDCKGYKTVGEKFVVCVDCSKEFKVESKVKKQDRCSECYKIYRNNYQKELMRKRKF